MEIERYGRWSGKTIKKAPYFRSSRRESSVSNGADSGKSYFDEMVGTKVQVDIGSQENGKKVEKSKTRQRCRVTRVTCVSTKTIQQREADEAGARGEDPSAVSLPWREGMNLNELTRLQGGFRRESSRLQR